MDVHAETAVRLHLISRHSEIAQERTAYREALEIISEKQYDVWALDGRCFAVSGAGTIICRCRCVLASPVSSSPDSGEDSEVLYPGIVDQKTLAACLGTVEQILRDPRPDRIERFRRTKDKLIAQVSAHPMSFNEWNTSKSVPSTPVHPDDEAVAMLRAEIDARLVYIDDTNLREKVLEASLIGFREGCRYERERAAKIADSFEDGECDNLSRKTRHLTAQSIAAAIRNRKGDTK